MPTDLPPPKPTAPPPRRRWGLRWFITLPLLSLLIGYELLRPTLGQGNTDWAVVGVAGAGIVMSLFSRATQPRA